MTRSTPDLCVTCLGPITYRDGQWRHELTDEVRCYDAAPGVAEPESAAVVELEARAAVR